MTPQHGWNDATILLIHGGLWEEASMPVPYPALPSHPVSLMAGSTGCSVSVRIALALPDRERLLLAWPATAGDPAVDSYIRKSLTGLGASEQTVRTLLDGQTLRGVTDAELSTLEMPISVPPSIPENPFHQRTTVDALRRLLADSEELPGCLSHPAQASDPI